MLKLLFWLLVINLTACLAQPETHLESQGSSITVSGRLTSPTGEYLSQAAIYRGDDPNPFTYSDAFGYFSMTIPAENEQVQQSVRLYYATADKSLVGISSTISLYVGQSLDLGEELLRTGEQISGHVSLLNQNQNQLAAQGAKVSLGRYKVTTDGSGNFTFPSIPVGLLSFEVQLAGYIGHASEVLTDPLLYSENSTEVVLFKDRVAGVVVLANRSVDPQPSELDFVITASSDVRFVRMGIEGQNLTASGELTGPWIPVTDYLSYDMAGKNTLYYQFADDNQEIKSKVYKLVVVGESL